MADVAFWFLPSWIISLAFVPARTDLGNFVLIILDEIRWRSSWRLEFAVGIAISVFAVAISVLAVVITVPALVDNTRYGR